MEQRYEEYLEKHALGVRAVKRAESAIRYHAQLGDDWHPYISLELGPGIHHCRDIRGTCDL